MYQCEQPRENFQLLINKRDFPTQTGIHHLRDSGMNNSTEKSAKQILAIQPNTSPSLIHQFRWFSSATQLRIRITPIVILFVGPAGVPLTRLRPSAERPSTWTPKKPGKTNLRQWLKVFRSYLDISEKVDYYSYTQMIYTYFAVAILLSLTSSVIGMSSMLHTIQESASSTSEPGSNGPKPARAEWGIWAFTPIGLFLVIMFFGSCMLSSAFGSIPVAMRYLSGERVIAWAHGSRPRTAWDGRNRAVSGDGEEFRRSSSQYYVSKYQLFLCRPNWTAFKNRNRRWVASFDFSKYRPWQNCEWNHHFVHGSSESRKTCSPRESDLAKVTELKTDDALVIADVLLGIRQFFVCRLII